MPKPRVSLRDVARAAGVAAGTASEALRGYRRVSLETRERVAAAARRLGYRPDPLMSSAASGRFRSLRKLRPEVGIIATMRSPKGPLMLLQESAEAAGYSPHVSIVHTEHDLSRQMKAWERAGVRGLIISLFHRPDWIRGSLWGRFSIVHAVRAAPIPRVHQVTNDLLAAWESAMKTACQRGFQRLGVCLHHHEPFYPEDVLREGFVRVLESTMPERRFLVLKQPFGTPWDQQVANVAQWIQRDRPEVVIGHSEACVAARQFKPDLPLLNVDGRRFEEFESAVDDFAQIARLAVDLLDGMIRRGEVGFTDKPVTTLVPPIWHIPPAVTAATPGADAKSGVDAARPADAKRA